MDHCGILYNAYDVASNTFSPAQVPLEEVRVKVWVVYGASISRAKRGGGLMAIFSRSEGDDNPEILQQFSRSDWAR